MKTETDYIGNELDLFAHAVTWKKYWGQKIVPYLGNNVLEVGAGIGTNTNYLINENPVLKRWVCIEPDHKLSKQIEENIAVNNKEKVQVFTSYLSDFKTDEKFDSIIYIDVIEHIKNDYKEIERAKTFLKDGGFLIILVPAHNFLYSDFDKSIGHFRRYNKNMLKKVIGDDLSIEKLTYLDSVGMGTSLMNKLFLKQSYPTLKQIKFWDSYLVPLSKISDKVLLYQFGKTVLGIWRK